MTDLPSPPVPADCDLRGRPWTLHVGDALAVLATLHAASVDLIIADPPYGETRCQWDTVVDGWLQAARHILRPSGSAWVFGSFRHLLSIDLTGWQVVQDVVWEKHNGSSMLNDRFRRVHELALHLRPVGSKWAEIYHEAQRTRGHIAKNVRRTGKPAHWGQIGSHTYTAGADGSRLMRSVLQVRSEHRVAIHPTQKPIGILAPLVRYSCPPGGIVLDPFAGSGSTGVAAMANGRRFIGIEADPVMAAKARDRLADAERQGQQLKIAGVA